MVFNPAAGVFHGTKAQILALPAAAKLQAFSTDTTEMFIGDGTNWRVHAIPLGIHGVGPDRGAFPYEDTYGYGIKDLSDKSLHNVVIRDFETGGVSALEPGAFKYFKDVNKLQFYDGTQWLDIITLTIAQVADWMLQSNYNTYAVTPSTSTDTETKTVMTLGFVDIGAIPADVCLDGGVLI